MATGAIAQPIRRPREYSGILSWIMTTDHKKIGIMYLVFTMHASTMLFLFVIPVGAGFGNYLLPLMIGAKDMAYPRINAFALWLIPLAALVMFSSFFVKGGTAQAGWTSYPPLSTKTFLPGHGTDLWILGVQILGISSVGGAINFLVTTMTMRAPGMTLGRLPIFVWM